MPQTGPDLVSAGYPISNALTALLGGTSNGTVPNVPVYSNLYFNTGALVDASLAANATGSVYAVPVPVVPGAVISKISWVVGATSAASANVTNLWSALYTGSGSAPGTSGAQPVLISAAASLAATNVPASSLLTFTLAQPQTITSVQAPYGFVYVAYACTTSASPTFSMVSSVVPTATQYPWFTTSPVALCNSSNGGTAASVPAALNGTNRSASVPIVLLY